MRLVTRQSAASIAAVFVAALVTMAGLALSPAHAKHAANPGDQSRIPATVRLPTSGQSRPPARVPTPREYGSRPAP
jgi:hypothetical protein